MRWLHGARRTAGRELPTTRSAPPTGSAGRPGKQARRPQPPHCPPPPHPPTWWLPSLHNSRCVQQAAGRAGGERFHEPPCLQAREHEVAQLRASLSRAQTALRIGEALQVRDRSAEGAVEASLLRLERMARLEHQEEEEDFATSGAAAAALPAALRSSFVPVSEAHAVLLAAARALRGLHCELAVMQHEHRRILARNRWLRAARLVRRVSRGVGTHSDDDPASDAAGSGGTGAPLGEVAARLQG